ncbi:MAG: LPXTG cell wall anchor domain-containing protein [Phycisphaerae bacterium]|nr:LPXTG cell wall anchor domain-containing protein [Phycisphaerae bacterium]
MLPIAFESASEAARASVRSHAPSVQKRSGVPVNAGSPEFQFATIEVIPAPAGAALLGLGGLVAARRRRD